MASFGNRAKIGPASHVLAGLAAGVLLLLLSAAPLHAQTGTLVGRVTGEDAAPVRGAAVTLRTPDGAGILRTTLTDAAGTYRFVTVPPGRYRVRADFIGFRGEEAAVEVRSGTLARADLTLGVAAVEVEAIEVRARRDQDRERARFETEAGVTARVIGGGELKVLPGLAEADVLRAVELLPGVVSTSDFSSAFNVRGGSADQNLILIDGFPIFNPFHLGGLFSVFNPDMVARAELFAGGFGAEYGGRVSSVLNVESRLDAESERVAIDGGVSLLAARMAARAAWPDAVGRVLGGEGGGWAVSARRSYFDQILRPVIDFPYHLTDLQLHASIGTRGGGRLRLTGYIGEDVLDLTDFTPPGEDPSDILRIDWRWGNDVIGLHWQQPMMAGWVADTRVGFSRYRDGLRFADFDDTRFSSRISQLSFRSDASRDFAALSMRSGIEATRLWYANLAEAGGTVFGEGADDGLLGAAYLSTRWRPSERWLLEAGARVDGWAARDTTLTAFSPRLAAKRFLGSERDAAVKISAGRYVQYLQSLRNEEFPLSNDIWITAGPRAPKVVSDQVQIGFEKYWGETWSASVEGYVRSFEGVTEFNPGSDPNDETDNLLVGRGLSRGLDLMVRRTAGPLTGWTTLSLLRAHRTFPDPLAAGFEELPSEIRFPPFWDRRVNVNIVAQYSLPRETELGARWNFGSGLPYTRPSAQHVAWEYGIANGRYRPARPPFGDGDDRVPLFVVPGERNAERYPAYHRLDLTVRRTFRRRWGSMTPYAQVLNAYNRSNVLFYFYNFDRTPPTRSGISMFPVLPTIGVEATF
jgi:hypothetical protein